MNPTAAGILRQKLGQWFSVHGRELPWRTDPSPYAVMVSEFMLQQTQVATVIPYFQRWMAALPSVQSLAQADEDTVLRLWQGLGYYSRARNLHRAAKEVANRFGGRIPSHPQELITLPGVGAYSAGAIASFGFDLPAAAVDANIARVLARIANLETPVDSTEGLRSLWELAEALLPEGAGGRLHNSSLMELGALVCSPKKPQCLICPIQTDCTAANPEQLPVKARRKAIIPLDEYAAWIQKDAAVLLERQTGRRAGGLWKLPASTKAPSQEAVFETKYPFTHHKVTLRVHEAPAPEFPNEHQQWFALDSVLDEVAMPVGHKRALCALMSRNPPQNPTSSP